MQVPKRRIKLSSFIELPSFTVNRGADNDCQANQSHKQRMEGQGRATPKNLLVFPGELPEESCAAVAQQHDREGQTV